MNINSFFDMTGMAVEIGVIMGIAQIAKGLGLNPKFIPILNIAVGILIAILILPDGIRADIFNGIILGLSASGLYSSQKNIIKGIKDEK